MNEIIVASAAAAVGAVVTVISTKAVEFLWKSYVKRAARRATEEKQTGK